MTLKTLWKNILSIKNIKNQYIIEWILSQYWSMETINYKLYGSFTTILLWILFVCWWWHEHTCRSVSRVRQSKLNSTFHLIQKYFLWNKNQLSPPPSKIYFRPGKSKWAEIYRICWGENVKPIVKFSAQYHYVSRRYSSNQGPFLARFFSFHPNRISLILF